MGQGTGGQRRALDQIRAAPGADSRRRILLKGPWLVDPLGRTVSQADVLIVGDRIAAVDVGLAVDDAVTVDLEGMIVMPGLIDCHVHAWEGSLRGIAPAASFDDYLALTHRGVARFCSPEDLAVGERVTVAQAINAGTTTIIDNSHNLRSHDHAAATIEALRSTGIRAVFAAGSPLFPLEGVADPVDVLRIRDEYFTGPDQLVQLRRFDLDPTVDSLRWASANELGVCAEFGMWTAKLDELMRAHVLGPSQTFNHCIGLPEEVWRALAEAGVAINLAVRSDAQYGFGACPVMSAQRADVPFGLSTDNETAYPHDLFSEMRVLFALQRALASEANRAGGSVALFQPWDVLAAATTGGAHNAGLSGEVGAISPGQKADLAVISLSALQLRPHGAIVGAVVNAVTPADVDAVLVDGTPRKWGGELVDVDVDALVHDAEESRARLLDAAGLSVDQAISTGVA